MLFLFAGASTMFFSCSNEDALDLQNEMLELQSPYGEWKLRGYGTTESKQEILVTADRSSYYLTLKKDSTFTGTSSTNQIGGKFTIDTHRGVISFSQADFYFTNSKRVNETNEGSIYLSRLLKVTNYRVYTDQLHLYYSDKEYMAFVKPGNK